MPPFRFPVSGFFVNTSGKEYSVVQWTAPTSGNFDLLGVFVGADTATTDVHVLKNGLSRFDGQIRAQVDTSIFDFHINLVKGDTIDFAVGIGPDGSMNNDSTGLKATITGRRQKNERHYCTALVELHPDPRGR